MKVVAFAQQLLTYDNTNELLAPFSVLVLSQVFVKMYLLQTVIENTPG